MARGPAYPYIDLETAVELAKKLYDYAKRSVVPLDSVIREAWNYSPTSSSGIKVFAAMKYFGLVDANATGDSLRLSDRAYLIVVDDPDSEDRKEAIREAALLPKQYRYCWDTWGAEMPPAMKRTLIFKDGFVETTVDGFLRDYKKSIDFAGLAEHRKMQEETATKAVESSSLAGRQSNSVQSPLGGPERKVAAAGGHMRQEVFSLAEGTVAIEWPGDLSPESFEDLSDWLDILKRKIGRAAKPRVEVSHGEEQEAAGASA